MQKGNRIMKNKVIGIVRGTTDSLMRRWENGDFDDVPVVRAGSVIARHASDICDGTRDGVRRVKDGYDDLDIWNLGDRLLLRLADFVDDAIRTGSYQSVGGDVTEDDLRLMSSWFRAYAMASDGLDSLRWPLGLFDASETRELNKRIDETLDSRFIVEWDSFCETFLIGDMAPSEKRAGIVTRLWHRLSGKPNARDIETARIDELRRITAMLREYCSDNYGCPFDYGDQGSRFDHLMSRPDGWESNDVPFVVRFWGNREVLGDAKTVEEAGADYVLFIGDIATACSVIGTWTDWLDGKAHGFDAETPLYPVANVLRTTEDGRWAFDEIEDRLSREFRHAWHWLGTIILSIWL